MHDNNEYADGQERWAIEKIRYESYLGSLQKFRLFFAGLVFAILAFSVQFAIIPSSILVNVIQVMSWSSLIITGILAVRECGGFALRYPKHGHIGLKPKSRGVMWFLFVTAIVLLIVVRVIN